MAKLEDEDPWSLRSVEAKIQRELGLPEEPTRLNWKRDMVILSAFMFGVLAVTLTAHELGWTGFPFVAGAAIVAVAVWCWWALKHLGVFGCIRNKFRGSSRERGQ